MNIESKTGRQTLDNTAEYPKWSRNILGAMLIRDHDTFDALQPNKVWWKLVLVVDEEKSRGQG